MSTKPSPTPWKKRRHNMSDDEVLDFLFANTTTNRFGCMEWNRCLRGDGYGVVSYRGEKHGAHRLAYELFYGVKIGDKFACHKCDNPRCINPWHIFLGTNTDNVRDCFAKGRITRHGLPKGIKHPNAKLSDTDVVEIRKLFGKVKTAELVVRYGCDRSYLWQVAVGRARKFVKAPPAKRLSELEQEAQ